MRRYRPLRGVRVLSFEAAFSLPAATRVLAELGAEVVRIGRPSGDFPPFVHRTDGSAINKQSLSVNLQHEAGRALAFRLATAADVVCNNFRPHFLRGLGLTYEALRDARPDVIMLQLSGYGTPGPWQEIGAFGPSVEAAGGMDKSIGLPDDPPTKVGSTVFADQTAGRYAALAIIMALERRRATGQGRHIDLSMYEGIAHILGDRVLGAACAGPAPARLGNRSPMYAPQNIYPASGNDQWVAITVRSDEEWRALCDLAGSPELLALRDADLEQRRREHDRIDAALAAWTRTLTKERAAELLQARRIPAAPVQKAGDVPFDPQLRHRGAFQMVRHEPPVLGYRAHPHLTLAWQTRGYARPPLEDARPDGADNRAVLRGWLGLGDAEIAALADCPALLPPHLPEVSLVNRMPGAAVDPDFAERLGLEPAL